MGDGVITEVKDGIPENIPGASRAVPITLETIGGNYVIIDLGGGFFAFYAHLQPDSLKVKVGERVEGCVSPDRGRSDRVRRAVLGRTNSADGQRHGERGPLARSLASRRHRTAVRFDEVTDNRQTKAKAVMGTSRGSVDLPEPFEDVWQVLG